MRFSIKRLSLSVFKTQKMPIIKSGEENYDKKTSRKGIPYRKYNFLLKGTSTVPRVQYKI